jgi:hypothetical protein
MSKGSAKFTEADVRRVIKGARQAGAERVEVDLRTGRVAVILSGGTMIAAEETAPAMAEWDDVLNERDKHDAASASEDDAKKRQ